MENLNYVIHLFHSGGYVMYPLLFLSLMVIAIAVERTFYYRKYAGKTYMVTHAVNEYAKLQKWDEIEKVIKENPSIASRIAEAGLKNGATEEGMKTAFSDQMGVDAVGFRKYMDYLSATVTISPLLGLLGRCWCWCICHYWWCRGSPYRNGVWPMCSHHGFYCVYLL